MCLLGLDLGLFWVGLTIYRAFVLDFFDVGSKYKVGLGLGG